jgi:hypothetical protein
VTIGLNRRELIVFVVLACLRPSHSALAGAGTAPSSPLLVRFEIPRKLAEKLGRKIWMNETGGDPLAITDWNGGEDFMSLGIGHFIWFPVNRRRDRFEESFPPMLEFLREKGIKLPTWIDQRPIPPCPWKDRQDFKSQFNSPEMVELREFLQATFAGQTQFLISRTRQALPRILATLDRPADRERVREQFDRVARASPDCYPLVDYTNFKGEGIARSETFEDKETGAREGWGLKQVLFTMSGAGEGQAALDAFADAAKAVLQRRIRNVPADEIRTQGWLARCDSYRRASRT